MKRSSPWLDLILIVAIVFVALLAILFLAHWRPGEVVAADAEPERALSLPIPEQERLPAVRVASVDNFIEDGSFRSSTGASEPHRAIPEGIDPEDRDLVERIVMAEAGAEPYQGIVAVAQVILDQCSEWGISIRETCAAPGRFTEPYDGDVSDLVRLAVHEVFDLGVRVTDGPITHFHNPTVDPDWAHTLTFVTRIGDHLFYR